MAQSLDRLLHEIRACRVCVERPQGPPLPHEPRPVVRASLTARILIAGQAPGTRVHRSGLPFDDPSGDRLRAWMDVTREAFYDERLIAFAPMGFCFPGLDDKGGDRPPRKECAPMWRSRLIGALPAVDLMLLVGWPAQRWHLGSDAKANLTETVRAAIAIADRPGPVCTIPLPHPSWRNSGWLKANAWFDAEVVPRLRREVSRRVKG